MAAATRYDPSSLALTRLYPSVAGAAGYGPAVQQLFEEYVDMLNPSKMLHDTSHGVAHHLQTTDPPLASPFWQLDAEKLAAA